MRIVLFDPPEDRIKLLPLSLTRPICDLRVGILTIREKWARIFPKATISVFTSDYLFPKFGTADSESALWINATILPDEHFISHLKEMNGERILKHSDEVLAYYGKSFGEQNNRSADLECDVSRIRRAWDIFTLNGAEIKKDFNLITRDKISEALSDLKTIVYGSDIFIEKGANIKAAVLNAENGPIYIGANAEIQEGALIRGPFSLGESSVVSLGAKIRGDTTIGPFCKVGGEVSNSVFIGYSNKGHDGFLGNSVIGEWCNLGASTNNSNLKNNYKNVKMWDFEFKSFTDTGLQFCGLVMADHSKTGISTMFNTGTTVGVSANIFGSGFPRTYIPSFSWGGAGGFSKYEIEKAIETATLVMKRRNMSLTSEDIDILTYIFDHLST